MNTQPTLLSSGKELKSGEKITFLHKIITDRGSKYSVTCIPITTADSIKTTLRKNINHKFYHKATHNTYAWRRKREDGSIVEGKNDDGETGAGLCILRELKRVNFVGGIVVVTRYYGGTKLQNDRFKHVIDATKTLIEQLKKG